MALVTLVTLAQAAELISPGEAMARAREQNQGRVISTQLVTPPQGEPYYRVKILNDGKVEIVRIPAKKN